MSQAARVHKHAAALRDLVEHFVYLAENAGVETAERFLARVETSLQDLARFPEMGTRVKLRRIAPAELRRWQIKDFENFLIFYQIDPDGISIVPILQGAQDWISLLEEP